jgi:phage terminase small subunit
MKLSAKQEAFCRFYLANGSNATAAARQSGYSEKTAESQGSRLLRNVKVREFIETEKKKLHDKLKVDAEWVREMLVEEAQPLKRRDSTQAGRIRALELIGKDMRMWSGDVEGEDKEWLIEVTEGDVGTPNPD